MELKKYQRRVMKDLRSYLEELQDKQDAAEAYRSYWALRGVRVGGSKMPAYVNSVAGAPHVCFKVPTGGGKTFLACNAIKPIFDAADFTKAKAVVWLVPSDAILEQTVKTLTDTSHPYRQKIDVDFGGRVEVYTKAQLLAGQNFNPTSVYEQLSIFVLSYDSFRTGKKEGRKAYQENSSLYLFAEALGEPEAPIEGADETALIQVINQLHPLVIVDESHHAKSTLSLEMLNNFNPCFVLDLTATPAKNSNVISYVDAVQLKAENMVKLPVIVYNRSSKEDVLVDAIDFRQNLEDSAAKDAGASEAGIRPIVLFQAQPKGKEDSTTFEKLRDKLVEFGVPAEQIAIKTANVNELRNVDLMDPACPIRFIITVNALKEGWDCPNAYILATLANKTSQVDVEQVVGRILRQPHTRKYDTPVLNMSYVLTSSADFQATVNRVIAGLNSAGFSTQDYRAHDEGLFGDERAEQQPQPAQQTQLAVGQNDGEEFLDFDDEKVSELIASHKDDGASGGIAAMEALAQEEAMDYERKAKAAQDDSGFDYFFTSLTQGYSMKDEYRELAEAIVIPQFYKTIEGNLFCESQEVPLTQAHLLEGFSLKGKDSQIDFKSIDFDMYKLDVMKGGAVSTQKLMGRDSAYIKKYFSGRSPESKVRVCKGIIHSYLNKDDAVSSGELEAYIDRIVGDMTSDELSTLEKYPTVFAKKIREKIDELEREYCTARFAEEIERASIVCKPSWKLPGTIAPAAALENPVAKSLYESEEDVNGFEREMMMALSGLGNIVWWHRNIARREFAINGLTNHYPDFMAYTSKGRLLLIETKGDHLNNPETRAKLRMGRQWQNSTRDEFRYYMVFQNNDPGLEGAYEFGKFLELVTQL
ncbi:MAG: DEAD/DEAH box helicase family protein [Eggerthellaceae bacterium]|nr:DEAD/DEAH box helicase family protein [Eggerthellaceae bacterium]